MSSSDVDNDDNTFVAETVSGDSGDVGTLSITASGDWTFSALGAFDSLNSGDVAADTFTVQSIDGTTQTIDITINGANDAATISGDTSVTTTETDQVILLSGTLTSFDPDNVDDRFIAETVSGDSGGVGTLTMSASGDWDFTAAGVFDDLNSGVVASDTFTVQSVDGTTQSIDITINGTNDPAEITGLTEATANESNETLILEGQLAASDVDNLDDTFVAGVFNGASGGIGQLSIDVSGGWTFIAASEFNELNVGEVATDTYTVQSTDGTSQDITITINGTNDAALISGDFAASGDETDSALQFTGSLSSSDVDNADNTFVAETVSGDSGDVGTLSITASGDWAFNALGAFDSLNSGDVATDTFTIQSIDGTTQTIDITINGTNDPSVISGDFAASGDETGTALEFTGSLTSLDPDNADNTFVAETVSGDSGGVGTLSVTASGDWTFNALGAFDSLNSGDVATDTFTIQSIDGTTQTIDIAINGTNDPAVISGDFSASGDETDSALQFTGSLSSSDVDNDDNTFVAETVSGDSGDVGTLSITASGDWTFSALGAFDSLNSGDVAADTFTVQSIDGTTQTIDITINGANDAATISGDTSVTTTETDHVGGSL